MTQLLFFSRPDCPLCDAAEAMAAAVGIEYDYRDISGDLELLTRYHTRIPVFRHPETGQELGAPITVAALKELASQ